MQKNDIHTLRIFVDQFYEEKLIIKDNFSPNQILDTVGG